jgi:hypothetical protein
MRFIPRYGFGFVASLIPVSAWEQMLEFKPVGTPIAASSDNSATAAARTSRKYGPGRSFGLLGSLWDDSWVHPEG